MAGDAGDARRVTLEKCEGARVRLIGPDAAPWPAHSRPQRERADVGADIENIEVHAGIVAFVLTSEHVLHRRDHRLRAIDLNRDLRN
jgi:hypothetical protein